MIESLTTILLCFATTDERKKCRSMRRRNDGPLSSVNNFVLDSEFDLNPVVIPDPKHDHWMSSIANYQGFPLVLGATDNVKLEMLNTMKSPPEWVEYEDTDYPYLNQ